MIKLQKYTLLALFGLLFLMPALQGQGNYHLDVRDTQDSLLYKGAFADSLLLLKFIDSFQREDFRKGNLLSSIDRFSMVDSVASAVYYQGPVFEFGQIEYDRSQEWLKGFLDYNLRSLENKPLAPERLAKISDRILVDLENRGYPFAQISLDSTSIVDRQLFSTMNVDRKDFIVFDTIENIGNAKISSNFLYRYLDIESGAPYDRRKVQNLKSKMRELSFLKLKEDPKIRFVNKKAEIVLNLNKSKSSYFDFIVGLLQNNTPQGQQFTLVSSFTAEMRNQMGYGERFYLQFQRLKPENQSIELAFDYPFILDSPFGVNVGFSQFRNEDQWIDRAFDVGGQYYLQGRDYFNLYWNNKTSSIINIDTMTLLSTQSLPQNLDISYNGLGVGFYKENLDYRFNPSSGYEINIGGEAGIKEVKRNAGIESLSNEDVDFVELYDSIATNTYQITLNLKAAYFQPIGRSVTIKTSVDAAYRFNENQLFQNELFRIGGNKLLRGFDEQSILSSFYSVFTAELRFILAQQGNNFTLSLPFIDYGLEYNPLRAGDVDDPRWDQPIGIGVGMNFQTKAGIFSFATAVGKRRANSFDFSNLKIHFGYVNLF